MPILWLICHIMALQLWVYHGLPTWLNVLFPEIFLAKSGKAHLLAGEVTGQDLGDLDVTHSVVMCCVHIA